MDALEFTEDEVELVARIACAYTRSFMLGREPDIEVYLEHLPHPRLERIFLRVVEPHNLQTRLERLKHTDAWDADQAM